MAGGSARGRARRRGLARVVAVATAVGTAAVLVGAAPASATPTYSVTTVGVGRNPQGVAVDPATDTIYTANYDANSVSVIDGSTNTVTATIGVGSLPVGVAVDPATDIIYVANEAGSVSVIDGARNTVTATIGVGGYPQGVAVDLATDTIYVTNVEANSVSVIDGARNTVTATIGVGGYPQGVAVDPATDTIYTANDDGNSASVIDGSTNTVTATIGVGRNPFGVAVDPATDTIYTANSNDNSVSVIDGASNTVTATIGVGRYPQGVAVDPATDTIYTANDDGNSASVIDGSTNTVTATIPVGAAPLGVDVDPDTHTVYVANESDSTVSVITSASDTDLAISTPANIATDATGPGGASVTYPMPRVTDEDTPLPSPSCTPASGTVFPIGTTTVTCSVTDTDDTPSTVSSSFTVSISGTTPTVTHDPVAVTVRAGQDAVFTAVGTGDPAPTVSWQQSGDGGTNWTDITGATDTTLSLHAVDQSMNGNQYRAQFHNTVGTATSAPALLSVLPPGQLTITADNQSITYGQPDPQFSYTVTGPDSTTALATDPSCTVTGAHSNAGSYPITCTGAVAEPGYQVQAYVAGTLTIHKATLSIEASNVTLSWSQLLAPVVLSATVTNAATGEPVAGASVHFTVNYPYKPQCTATTNTHGVASCHAGIALFFLLGLIGHPSEQYTAAVNASSNYLSGQATGTIELATAPRSAI